MKNIEQVAHPSYYQGVSAIGKPIILAACPSLGHPLGKDDFDFMVKLHEQFRVNASQPQRDPFKNECRLIQKLLESRYAWRHSELTALKYLWRCGLKGDEIVDLQKARFYLLDSWDADDFQAAIGLIDATILALQSAAT